MALKQTLLRKDKTGKTIHLKLASFPRRRSNSLEHVSKKHSHPEKRPEWERIHTLQGRNRSKSVEAIKKSLSHFVYTRDNLELDIGRHKLHCLNIVKSRGHWTTVERKLNVLKFKLDPISNFRDLLRRTILSYCEASATTNFRLLDDEEIIQKLKTILPHIVDMALDLPNLFPAAIPYLEHGDNATISISRRLCASLLANAFLCTIPEENRTARSGEPFPYINFCTLFDIPNPNPGRYSMKKEKLKCILSYFSSRFHNAHDDFEMILYQRKAIGKLIDWKSCGKNLCRVQVTTNENIEDALGKLQVDFANRCIGGGVLNNGCVQEEIRFAAFPELILGRLFMEPFGDQEVGVISGVKKYSEYSGYSTTFKYLGHTSTANQRGHKVVAMDATYFRRDDSQRQYGKSYVDRELHKAYVGFYPGNSFDHIPVATGNWGCGAFNGDRQLKFFIQWLAASANERESIQYHTFGDERQAEEILKMSGFLLSKKTSVGELYQAVVDYDKVSGGNASIFKYVYGGASKKKKSGFCTFV